MRDDFSPVTARILAARIVFRCSNPNCLLLTIGPDETEEKTVSIGVAAHICAASPGGPRYDPKMTPDENRSQMASGCAKTAPEGGRRGWTVSG